MSTARRKPNKDIRPSSERPQTERTNQDFQISQQDFDRLMGKAVQAPPPPKKVPNSRPKKLPAK